MTKFKVGDVVEDTRDGLVYDVVYVDKDEHSRSWVTGILVGGDSQQAGVHISLLGLPSEVLSGLPTDAFGHNLEVRFIRKHDKRPKLVRDALREDLLK